jgi:hypothetical protein
MIKTGDVHGTFLMPTIKKGTRSVPARREIITKNALLWPFFSDIMLKIYNLNYYSLFGIFMDIQLPLLDRLDRRILRVLQDNDAGLSNLELAEQVGLSPTPCAQTRKAVDDRGRHHPSGGDGRPQKLGLNLTAHISVTMDRHTPDRFEAFEETVLRCQRWSIVAW